MDQALGRYVMVDGNEAAASVAHRLSEVIAIFPITPSSPMGELADEWSVAGRRNIWGAVPRVVEMQSEGGAAGAVHGALQAGALATTFTASQGLLLMIPNMYKIAGELTPFCMHVAARTLATHALSIFGDHSDVMACRQTGFALLASGSVQEAHDFAAIAHAATLSSRIPFLHFFDGFRTSHEVSKIRHLADADLRALIDEEAVQRHRAHALSPEHPVVRGTAQNPDTFFQAREACNPFYLACPGAVEAAMDRFCALTGRRYQVFDYLGHPQADRVVVVMGSGGEAVHETVRWMLQKGEKVGVVKVRLYRPFSGRAFLRALPESVRSIAVLDRTKEPGSVGEPLYLDVLGALAEGGRLVPQVIGGRYGLSSKEFTPAMVAATFCELQGATPKRHFTVGINDDVSHTSIPFDSDLDIESPEVVRAVFYGLGSDGTVGANKNSIKIIGSTGHFAQGYFVYDSKKSGAVTISHLRFGPHPIQSPYLIKHAQLVACHHFSFLERYDVLEFAAEGATLLLNVEGRPEQVWDRMPLEVQELIVAKGIRVYAVDAQRVAREAGIESRINVVMQTCFFALTQVLPMDQAIASIKGTIEKTYGKKGPEVVRRNADAVDRAVAGLSEVKVPPAATGRPRRPLVPASAPDFVQRVTSVLLAGKGDLLPVSAFPVDGSWPTGTSRWEKRAIAEEIPVWEPTLCIQCNKCALICPHAAIRAKAFPAGALSDAPPTFLVDDFHSAGAPRLRYSIQVAPEDCTGCSLCVAICPAKDKVDPSHKALRMAPAAPLREQERGNLEFFLGLPELDRTEVKPDVKSTQFLQPLFEFSGACAGCGETPYLKLLTQLFGDRALIANATGCSSIFGGNLPTAPYTTNSAGRGPAWANSLFEDNAEFGLGFRLALDSRKEQALALVRTFASVLPADLVTGLEQPVERNERAIAAQRQRIDELRLAAARLTGPDAARLRLLADDLVPKSVWIVGGDGWAYDIGYGGLDHVLASGQDVKVLVLDTACYSNTGGQQSKATPLGATAKFAAGGKEVPAKDLGMMAMSYGHVYVANVALGARDSQTVQAFLEAESYPGPALIVAYCHCIAHGYDMADGLEHQRLAVASGFWPLYRFDPRRIAAGQAPLKMDSPTPTVSPADFMRLEQRFRIPEKADPERFGRLAAAAEAGARRHFSLYQELAGLGPAKPGDP